METDGIETTRVDARCAWCGMIRIDSAGLEVHVAGDADALFEFVCPRCGRTSFGGLSPEDVSALGRAGIHPRPGTAPFELLEAHPGPLLTPADLLDFHERLLGMAGVPETTNDDDASAPPVPPAEQERRAA